MSAPSPQEFRELVRSQTDIVGLIGESISLQPRHGGRQFVGLCCFHDDRNPSLNVYPDRQTFRCWSCNTGGDVFTFVMQHDGLTFPEALELLARRANIPIPKRTGTRPEAEELNKARLLEVLQWAEREFHQALKTLPEAEPARRYLADRGFTQESISRYQLGFHPDDWNWLTRRAGKHFPEKVLLEAKLVDQKNGRTFDNYVNRVLFPIHNERGQAVSFGGRILPGSEHPAKYWNGPESPVFHKSRTLYALDHAREAIRRRNAVLVVEGYTDCLACHQAGMTNVVATLGTALTDQHVTALKRFTRQVVLLFDGDEAGRRAASKAVERFLAQDVDLRILTLPDNLDPAEFLAEHSVEDLRRLADSAPEAWEYQFRSLREQFGIETVDGRQRILDAMVNLLVQVPSLQGSLRESLLIANVAQRLLVPEDRVRTLAKELRRAGKNVPDRITEAARPREFAHVAERIRSRRLSRHERVECDLLEMLLAAPQHANFFIEVVREVPLRNNGFHEIFLRSEMELEENGVLTLSGLLARADDRELEGLIVWIDEQARAKGLASKIEQSGTDDRGCPLLIRHALDNLRWRTDEDGHEVVAAQLSQTADGSGQLDAGTEALLRQAADFHQRRANKTKIG